MEIKRGLEKATDDIVDFLKINTTPITKPKIALVATISANGD
jgi:chaperonin GroEL (HSP60 family)